jgi:hypothetical protein
MGVAVMPWTMTEPAIARLVTGHRISSPVSSIPTIA